MRGMTDLLNKTPAGSCVVVPAKTALRDVVTSVDVVHCWAVPSSPVSARNRLSFGATLLLCLFLFILYNSILAEPVYAMEAGRPRALPYIDLNLRPNRYGEPAVLPPQQQWLNELGEREIYTRIRTLQSRYYYNLPPQNHPGEYEGVVRENFKQALNLSHREEIFEMERFEISVLERKGLLQRKLLLLMRNEQNLTQILRDNQPNRLASPDRYISTEAYAFLEERVRQVGSVKGTLNRILFVRNLDFFIEELTRSGRNAPLYREFYSYFTGEPPAA